MQMSNNRPSKADDSGMPEKKYAGTEGATLIMTYIVLLSLFLLYLIVQLWPSSTTTTTSLTASPLTLFLWTFSIANEARLLLIVAIAGSLGSLLHGLRSVYWYFGNRELATSWYAKYLLQPLGGAIIGLLTYLLIRGGLLALQATTEETTPFAFAAISGLMGLFSEQAILKLKQVFEQLFTPPEKGKDQSKPTEEAKPEVEQTRKPKPWEKRWFLTF
jgi:hypothetical protein